MFLSIRRSSALGGVWREAHHGIADLAHSFLARKEELPIQRRSEPVPIVRSLHDRDDTEEEEEEGCCVKGHRVNIGVSERQQYCL